MAVFEKRKPLHEVAERRWTIWSKDAIVNFSIQMDRKKNQGRVLLSWVEFQMSPIAKPLGSLTFGQLLKNWDFISLDRMFMFFRDQHVSVVKISEWPWFRFRCVWFQWTQDCSVLNSIEELEVGLSKGRIRVCLRRVGLRPTDCSYCRNSLRSEMSLLAKQAEKVFIYMHQHPIQYN